MSNIFFVEEMLCPTIFFFEGCYVQHVSLYIEKHVLFYLHRTFTLITLLFYYHVFVNQQYYSNIVVQTKAKRKKTYVSHECTLCNNETIFFLRETKQSYYEVLNRH